MAIAEMQMYRFVKNNIKIYLFLSFIKANNFKAGNLLEKVNKYIVINEVNRKSLKILRLLLV